MEFHVLRINSGKLLGLLLTFAASALALLPVLQALDKYNGFLCAGAAAILLFGGGWALFRILEKAEEPVHITILPTALIEVNQLTGVRRQYPFSEITGYRFFPAFRGVATLRLMLSNGERAKVNGSDMSLLDNSNAAQFGLMVQSFKAAWERYQQTNKSGLAGS
jgi:hypothetical protein